MVAPRRYPTLLFALLSAAMLAPAGFTATPADLPTAQAVPAPGGATTVADASPHAFGRSAGNLRPEHWLLVRAGKAHFLRDWQPPVLGPRFNATSCAGCHLRDGRTGPAGLPRLIRLIGPEGRYGRQLQDFATPGHTPETQVAVHFEPVTGRYGDGTPYQLQRPRYRLLDLALGPLPRTTVLSVRTPPALIGMGLIEALPRPAGAPAGRFGWRAEAADLADQTTGALAEDLGVHVPSEFSPSELSQLLAYLRLLAVPARRAADDPLVRQGEGHFLAWGCASCHRPSARTGAVAAFPELAKQEIWPYSDFGLHDLGRELADVRLDGRPARGATSRRWRTAPLWGLGLLDTVAGAPVGLLHDGRARTVEEAILWHGGEARVSRNRFRASSAEQRRALVAFVRSL